MRHKGYEKSIAQHERAKQIIPLAAQTYSKSRLQYPLGVAPQFAAKAKGNKLIDIDGNEYIDTSMGLCAVTLGYNHPAVNNAIKKQLRKGSIFSLSTTLEYEVAELICELIPCAEMVRFGKNGTDATTAAVRMARAYTDRWHIAQCGYNGWNDPFVAKTTRNWGVPPLVEELTHKFNYNDLDSLKAIFNEYPEKVACVILEPMNVEYPQDDFLQRVIDLAHDNGAIVILDEVITAFRFRNSAQEELEVMPDLCTIGKGLGNGVPISAVCGKRDIMEVLEPDCNPNGQNVMFSGTFGGDCIGLAAAKAVLQHLVDTQFTETINTMGSELLEQTRLLLNQFKCNGITLKGSPAWSLFNFTDVGGFTASEIKTYFIQECAKEGLLTSGSFNNPACLSYKDIDRILQIIHYASLRIFHSLISGDMALEGKTLSPVMAVRGK